MCTAGASEKYPRSIMNNANGFYSRFVAPDFKWKTLIEVFGQSGIKPGDSFDMLISGKAYTFIAGDFR